LHLFYHSSYSKADAFPLCRGPPLFGSKLAARNKPGVTHTHGYSQPHTLREDQYRLKLDPGRGASRMSFDYNRQFHPAMVTDGRRFAGPPSISALNRNAQNLRRSPWFPFHLVESRRARARSRTDVLALARCDYDTIIASPRVSDSASRAARARTFAVSFDCPKIREEHHLWLMKSDGTVTIC